ncbi:protein GRINL1A [Brachyhypopomus gauderio]|uniref:protein GRINL1A n=1 Tax=Brachyhypopomus gauderio TaxID=698409 RepID=UPI0040434084
MSSSRRDHHGQLGDLGSKSQGELIEILSRQEKLLHNKKFINTLPDKGKKISDFADRVHLALAKLKEEETKRASLSTVREELQARYQHAFAQHHRITLVSNGLETAGATIKEDEDSLDGGTTHRSYTAGHSSSVGDPQSSDTLAEKSNDSTEASSGKLVDLLTDEGAKDRDLLEAFERVVLSEGKTASPKGIGKDSSSRNPFGHAQFHKKPHYIDILEKSDSSVREPRFKPNQLPTPTSPSPGQSPGSVTPLTAEARRQRDRKLLDDITAARLPPICHSPAQLLSLEESFDLLQEQKKRHQELQAKLAAQKLAAGLTVSMSSYNPEGGALGAYREVHDDGTHSEED